MVLSVLCDTISQCPSPSKAFDVLWDFMGGEHVGDLTTSFSLSLGVHVWGLLLTAQKKLEKLAIVFCPGV